MGRDGRIGYGKWVLGDQFDAGVADALSLIERGQVGLNSGDVVTGFASRVIMTVRRGGGSRADPMNLDSSGGIVARRIDYIGVLVADCSTATERFSSDSGLVEERRWRISRHHGVTVELTEAVP